KTRITQSGTGPGHENDRGRFSRKTRDDIGSAGWVRTGVWGEGDIVGDSSSTGHLPIPIIEKLYDTR
ncbi:MAG TPA: hypothetical protein PLE70_10055, partial [Methanolinea sp.]|nr:hypothetical protein [Methanolinea sp.]